LSQLSEPLMGLIAFIAGTCVGSFLNVCIYRLPAGMSVVDPARSRCPACKHGIAFYDNIPIVSFLILKRRCRHCGSAIAMRYLWVEVISGLVALGCLIFYGPTVQTLIGFSFIAALIVVTFIDIDHRIIPDVITLPGIIILFILSFVWPDITWQQSLLGILAGGGSLFAVAWAYKLLTGREGMGGGDIKLLAMIGALTGPAGVLFTIFTASAGGTLAGSMVMLAQRSKNLKLAIPFGPFLSIGAIVYLFWGPSLIDWYFGILR